MDTIKISYNGRGKKNSSKGMELDGNLLVGDTYNARDYIKKYLDGKWDAVNEGWRVNVEKTMSLLNTPGASITIK